jgi:CBS domain-containing protein
MITSVRKMLEGKGSIYTVPADASVFEALRIMAERNIGAVLVTDGDELAGILSERDYARKVILKGRSSRETRVREIMTSDVICIDPSWTAEQCMALMTEKRIRHLPAVENGRLIGVVSIGDVVRAVIDEQLMTISTLERYIASGA